VRRLGKSLTRRRLLIASGLLLLAAGIAINALAYLQARSMTHFVQQGRRTNAPESLTVLSKLRTLIQGVRIPRPENRTTPADDGLDFQTVRFGGASHDDCEAWYIPAVKPKGLILAFHAYTTCKASILPAAREFHELGYDVLMVDFRGSGGSRSSDTTIGYRESEDVAAAVDFAARQYGSRRMVLYGQSMGGCAILRAVALLGVQPAGIIIESTYDRLLSTVEDRFRAMGLPTFPLARLLVFWGGVQLGFDGFALNPADFAEKVRCPTLSFQGGLDVRVTNAQSQNLFNHLAGPKQFELYPNCGHCGFLTSDRARWIRAVSTLLLKSQSMQTN